MKATMGTASENNINLIPINVAPKNEFTAGIADSTTGARIDIESITSSSEYVRDLALLPE